MKDFIELIKNLNIGKIEENSSLKIHTTFKVGGNARLIIYPKDINSLLLLLKHIKSQKFNFKILGKGSNTVFSSKNYNNILIKLDNLNKATYKENIVTAESGCSLTKLAFDTAKKGLKGLDFAVGIPGSVGGAIYMNAGAYDSDISKIVKNVKVINKNFEIIELKNKELNFEYRSSIFKNKKDLIIIEATFKLEPCESNSVIELIKERLIKRKNAQPLEYPSAGSVFRNPEGLFAGRILEDLGFKGAIMCGAKVSEKHANFIINNKNAVGEDILKLINKIKKKVKTEYNIDLICEIELINFNKSNKVDN